MIIRRRSLLADRHQWKYSTWNVIPWTKIPSSQTRSIITKSSSYSPTVWEIAIHFSTTGCCSEDCERHISSVFGVNRCYLPHFHRALMLITPPYILWICHTPQPQNSYPSITSVVPHFPFSCRHRRQHTEKPVHNIIFICILYSVCHFTILSFVLCSVFHIYFSMPAKMSGLDPYEALCTVLGCYMLDQVTLCI